jgi:antitoxin FitA
MAQVLVRQLDDQVVHSLKRRAAVHGNSLEQELREILIRAAGPTKAEILAEMRESVARTKVSVSNEELLEMIREGLE